MVLLLIVVIGALFLWSFLLTLRIVWLGRLGVVKYDAFDDIGGSLSSSTVLLNDFDNGILSSEEKAAIQNDSERKGY